MTTFDGIDGSWFFKHEISYHICHITNSFYRRMMHEEDVRQQTKNHMLII